MHFTPYREHISFARTASSSYSSSDKSFSRKMIPKGRQAAIRSILKRKSSRHSLQFVTQIMSDIHIIVKDRLKPLACHVLIHSLKAAAVIDFKLLVTLGGIILFAGILALVVSDTG